MQEKRYARSSTSGQWRAMEVWLKLVEAIQYTCKHIETPNTRPTAVFSTDFTLIGLSHLQSITVVKSTVYEGLKK